MSDLTAPDPYDAVILDLRAKRDQIDSAITLLGVLRGGITGISFDGPQATPPAASSDDVTYPGAFLGMSIPEAARKLLAGKKRTLSNAEIALALKSGGLALASVDPMNTIGSVLTRRFMKVGDIVKVGRGVWGLKEWYPNRNFRKAPAGLAAAPALDGDDDAGDPMPDIDLGDDDEDVSAVVGGC